MYIYMNIYIYTSIYICIYIGKAYAAFVEDSLMFLLVWGEAANLKHCPECLCFLYHKTMQVYT
jgi:hypothetical protein